MKVCFITYEYPPNILGGAGTYANILINGLKNRGIDVHTISNGIKSNYHKKIYRIPSNNTIYIRRYFFMKEAMKYFKILNKNKKFNIIHFNEPHIIFQKPNIASVCTLHSNQLNELLNRIQTFQYNNSVQDILDITIKNPLGYITDLFTVNSADKLICPSYNLANLIQKYCFINKDDIYVVPNGINLDTYDKININDSIQFLNKYNIEKNKYFLYIGRITKLKGVDILIKSFNLLKKEYKDIKLVIVGSGNTNYINYLKSISNNKKDVIFTGYIESIKLKKILYTNSVAVVLLSAYEALPMVILEAMVCKKPVIASKIGDIPILIKHGKNGFLLSKFNDIIKIKEFLEIILLDYNLREKMGKINRQIVENKYSSKKMINRTIQIYSTLYN